MAAARARQLHGIGKSAGRPIKRNQFEGDLLRDGHHDLLQLRLRRRLTS